MLRCVHSSLTRSSGPLASRAAASRSPLASVRPMPSAAARSPDDPPRPRSPPGPRARIGHATRSRSRPRPPTRAFAATSGSRPRAVARTRDADRDGRAAADGGLPALRARRAPARGRRRPCARGARGGPRAADSCSSTDLGDRTYLAALDAASAPALYSDAIDALIRWQRATRDGALPPYDEALLARELASLSRLVRREASRRQRSTAGAAADARAGVPARSSTTISRSRACSSIATTIRAT